jgi:hypothetical protein
LFAGGFEDLEAGEAFVVRRDQVPRRGGGVGESEHVANSDFVGVPFATVAPVFVVYLVAFVRGFFAGAEAAELFVAADV